MSNKIEIAAGGIITKYDKLNYQVLVLLVKSNKQQGSHWGFPKGHVESKENIIETAIREINEETGISVKLQDYKTFWKNTYEPYPYTIKTVTYFWFKQVNESEPLILQKKEIKTALWINIEEAKKILSYQSDIKILEQFLTYLKNRLA